MKFKNLKMKKIENKFFCTTDSDDLFIGLFSFLCNLLEMMALDDEISISAKRN